MGKGKLHELLSVEPDLQGRSNTIVQETRKVFKEKGVLFQGSVRTYAPFTEDGIEYPEEHVSMTTTVDKKLAYASKSIAKYYDALLQKEATNQQACADLVVDGEVMATALPATFLLGMESRLKKLREVYINIPTLAMGVDWKEDEAKGEGVFSYVHPEEQLKQVATIKPLILHEATKEHPAQVEKMKEVISVGKYTRHVWSGMVTPARKSVMLDRLDTLIQSFKKARQRANTQEVVKRNIGNVLMGYINK